MESMFSWFDIQTIGMPQGSMRGFGIYPTGSALEFLEGNLKLQHFANLFIKRFLPWSSPGVGSEVGKKHFVTADHLGCWW